MPPSLRRHGEMTLPKALVSLDEPMANWSRLSLPSMPAPALKRLAETVDSYCGTKPLRMPLAAVVSTPWVQNRSFMPTGTPAILPRVSPFALALSADSAADRACSGVSTRKAFSGFAALTRAIKVSATSFAVKSPSAMPLRMPAIPN